MDEVKIKKNQVVDFFRSMTIFKVVCIVASLPFFEKEHFIFK
jgi:hypothetical protein